MNRAERRRQYKEIPGWMKDLQTAGRACQQMVRNGITPEDMEKAEKDAYIRGLDDGKKIATRTVYAASLLALKKLFGFGKERASRFLKETDYNVVYTIDTDELIDQVFSECGIAIRFKGYDALDGRVEDIDT